MERTKHCRRYTDGSCWRLFLYASVGISVTAASPECPAAGSDTADIFTPAALWPLRVGTEGQAATTAAFKSDTPRDVFVFQFVVIILVLFPVLRVLEGLCSEIITENKINKK